MTANGKEDDLYYSEVGSRAITIPSHFNLTNRKMRWMLYVLFGLIVADGLLTEFLVTNGYGLEGNPFLQAWVGQELFLAIKVSGSFLATLFLWIKYNKKPRPTYIITVVSLVFYTSIVFWNLSVFITRQLEIL